MEKSPYLYELLNAKSFFLISAVGAGVGIAAVIGTLRFLKGWSMKPLIYICLSLCLSLTYYVQQVRGSLHLALSLNLPFLTHTNRTSNGSLLAL